MPGFENFTMPSGVVVDAATATPRYAKFVMEPLESGFGNTLGNAMRRVLLSSMEGAAVSTLRIDDVPHEFTSIPDVVEEVTEIVLNIKKVRLICDGEMPRTLELVTEKRGPITAGMIREDGVTRVLNPELVICNLDKDRTVRMELEVIKGRGFRPAEENKREDQPIGVIPVDCLFSPVEHVRYDIQTCRVGQRTDYDRLELEVWTDGRVDPQEAVRQAAALLREHLVLFVGTKTEEAPVVQVTTVEEKELLDRLMISVNDLELSVRAKNCLNNAQIRVIGELVQKSEAEMLKYRNFGKKSLQEIKAKLTDLNLSLGMALKDEVLSALQRSLTAADKKEE